MGAIGRLVVAYAAPTYGNIWVATPYFPGRLFFFEVQGLDEDFDLEQHFGAVYDTVGCPFCQCLWGVFNGVVAPARCFPADA
jgi:hypothetical protein